MNTKRFIKYTSRMVFGYFAFLGVLLLLGAAMPTVDEGPCEAGQEEWSRMQCGLFSAASLIGFCLVWYKTQDW